MVSEDGRYALTRSPQDGFVPAGSAVTYTAIRLGKPWPLREGDRLPPGWDGSQVIATERVPDTPADRKAAINRLKELCHA